MGRSSLADVDFIVDAISCDCSACVKIPLGGAVGVDEVVGEAQEILRWHALGFSKGGTVPEWKVRQQHLSQKVKRFAIAVVVRRKLS